MTKRASAKVDATDAFALARWQLEKDRELCKRFPEFAERKRARMVLSPHALLRGSAPLFFEMLRATGGVEKLPKGNGVVVGDMHLENVGAYKTDSKDASVVFDLNDFDDAAHAPLCVDVLRLSVSVLLAGRTFGTTSSESVALVNDGIEAYLKAFFSKSGNRAPSLPSVVEDLLRVTQKRSPKALLDKRAPKSKGGKRRLIRGEHFVDLPATIVNRAPELWSAWTMALQDRAPKDAFTFRVLDAAQHVAGTGSLGALRIALLVEDEDGGTHIVDFKEARTSSVVAAKGVQATRVVNAARTLVQYPMRKLASVGPITLGRDSLSFVGRMLTPQEDKLDLSALSAWSEKEELVRLVYHLLGRAHRRGAENFSTHSRDDQRYAALVDKSLEFAGFFEGIALAYARLQ